ncbi:MAG: hypothetical protein ABL908_09210 [Hyphomicrobium sp.]
MSNSNGDCKCPGCLSMLLEGVGMLVLAFASVAAVLFGPMIVALTH